MLAVDGVDGMSDGRTDGDLLRTGQLIGIADVLIAATAMQHGLVLATGNSAH